MATRQAYSKSAAQQRTIESIFSIMLAQSPREAESLLVKLQRLSREKTRSGAGNVG